MIIKRVRISLLINAVQEEMTDHPHDRGANLVRKSAGEGEQITLSMIGLDWFTQLVDRFTQHARYTATESSKDNGGTASKADEME
jgi:hypothetical protein